MSNDSGRYVVIFHVLSSLTDLIKESAVSYCTFDTHSGLAVKEIGCLHSQSHRLCPSESLSSSPSDCGERELGWIGSVFIGGVGCFRGGKRVEIR